MPYGIVENNQLIEEFSSLQQKFPSHSFPVPMTPEALPENVVEVFVLPQPVPNPFQSAVALPTTFNPVSSRWEAGWDLVSRPVEDLPAILAEEKERKIAYINEQRLLANQTQFTHDGKTFQIDRLSRGDIDWVNGFVATRGVLPPSITMLGGWKAIDNTVYPIPDVAAWNAFYESIGVAGGMNFIHAQTLKAQVAAITDPATAWPALSAIVW